ncbi:MAG: putative selenium-dependent hydroxylase accessory protein YqeC [Clostridia bacterium]|nr:putative selenium-dependent hydroxylase accessory protein YqeC [Clostridia bacterium]
MLRGDGRPMKIREALQIPRGLTAVIGGGGKSTLLLRLGRELAKDGERVLLCTSTHMFAPPGIPLATTLPRAAALLESDRLVCFGCPGEDGKLTQGAPMEDILPLATYVLCEADGSKGLPLKAHASYEPNVPRETKRLVYVVGLDGIGERIAVAAHRPACYAALLGTDAEHRVTPRDAAAAIRKEGYEAAGAVLFLNKAEGERLAWGWQVAAHWPGRAVIAALQSPEVIGEVWENGTKQEM